MLSKLPEHHNFAALVSLSNVDTHCEQQYTPEVFLDVLSVRVCLGHPVILHLNNVMPVIYFDFMETLS